MSIFRYLLKYFLFILAIFTIGRVILFDRYIDRFINGDDNFWLTFIYGLRMDIITASILTVIPLILLSFFPKLAKSLVRGFLRIYYLIVISVVIYIEVATIPFFDEYDVRPNYLFVEYLKYPKEVFSMIFADYKLELLIAFLLISIFVYLYIKFVKDNLDQIFNIPYLKRVLIFIPIGLLLFIGIRSSFGHRPANNSDAMYSTNRTLNEITKNSLYSIGTAIYTNAKIGAKTLMRSYGKMDIDKAKRVVCKFLKIDPNKTEDGLLREVKSHFKSDHPKNLVIFLQESLGAQFVGALGAKENITPNIDRLSKMGIFFTNAYSNGTRSIRGIAGITAGNFSVPGKGVLKRNKSQDNYFSISKLLKPFGYYTSFIYGGESRFDNMRGWFLGNGFDKVIDQGDFKDPKFVGTWGVCDEEVVIRANKEFKKLHDSGKRFATVIFSTSNHQPFDYPTNKIELLKNEPIKGVKNAIKYADFAIGRLIELAKKSGYYDDTIFVIVADHNIRVYGNDMVPVNMFHIPALILGGGVKPLVYKKIVTQPDILATALDLLGLDLKYPIMGKSIFSDNKANIALLQFNDSYALLKDNKVAILRPNKKPLTFLYKNSHLVKSEDDRELEDGVRAFVVFLNYLYQNRLYR